ncbi:hypothetical protein E4U54_006334, partial [Claviceps lovelessii]
IKPTTIYRRPRMNWVSSWRRAKPAMTWSLLVGRSTRIPTQERVSLAKWPNRL